MSRGGTFSFRSSARGESGTAVLLSLSLVVTCKEASHDGCPQNCRLFSPANPENGQAIYGTDSMEVLAKLITSQLVVSMQAVISTESVLPFRVWHPWISQALVGVERQPGRPR